MNREFIFANSYNNASYPTNQPPAPRQDFYLYSPEVKKQAQSDLVIFNGEQPSQDMYNQQQKAFKPNLAFVPQRINKNSSQKSFPIIYNTYNNGGQIQPQTKIQNSTLNQGNPARNIPNQFDTFNENNHSNISDKQQNIQYRAQQTVQGQFHTFQHIPPESQPQTAKFLHLPDKHTQNYFLSSQTQPYRPPPQVRFENRQFTPVYNVQSHPLPTVFPQSKHESRVVHRPAIPISPSNRVIVQEPQRFYPQNYVQEKPKIITVPQEEYQRYVQHLAHCRKTQEENILCKTKIEELGQKQQFYWQQNMTLREENKRLRDLVSHFQKRQKELLLEREQTKHSFQEQIIKYRDSTLEQFRLLIERYKLEIQKKK